MIPDSNNPKVSKNPTSITEQSDSWLLHAWKNGDHQAAEVLFDRYAIRLIALVAGRLNRRFRSTIDPDEVVQSAMGSFFNAARHSRIEVSNSISMWRLLATFARRKMTRRIEKQSAAKRGGTYQQIPLEEVDPQAINEIDSERQDDASEFLRLLNAKLPGDVVPVIEGMLAGQTQLELANSLGIDERTVRRRLVRARELLGKGAEAMEPVADRSDRRPDIPAVRYNEFVLGKLIGSGGFGKVYHARMQVDGRAVAVKFLRKAFWQDDFARAAFLREIDLASRIKDPRIIQYLGYGESPHGGPYLLSQWVQGRTLREEANRSDKQFTAWLIQICEALETVHQSGLVHGDLTPSNILVDCHDRITITDFGFSQATASVASSIHGGTPGFAAPEQIDPCFGNIDARTDLYAIGGLVHWHLFGKPPNKGRDLASMIAETAKPGDRQKALFKDCTQPLRSVLEATLCPSPAERIQSANELIRMLR